MNNIKKQTSTTGTILDYEAGDKVYVSIDKEIVAAKILVIFTEIRLSKADKSFDKVETQITLKLATDKILDIVAYDNKKREQALYATVDDCINHRPVKSVKNADLQRQFAQSVYRHYGMTEIRNNYHLLLGCGLFMPFSTNAVENFLYDGFIYRHGNMETIVFTCGDCCDMNGTYDILHRDFNLFLTYEEAREALKPTVVEFPEEETDTTETEIIKAVNDIEAMLCGFVEGICIFATVDSFYPTVPAFDMKQSKNISAIAVTLQTGDEPHVITVSGESIPLRNIEKGRIYAIRKIVKIYNEISLLRDI